MAFVDNFAVETAKARTAVEQVFLNVPAAVEEGLQMVKPQCITSHDDNKVVKVDDSYGSVPKSERSSTAAEVIGDKARIVMQQLVVAIAALWLLFTVAHHLGTWLSAGTSRAQISPAPAPGVAAGSHLSCASYTYPQCEEAMRWYLSQTARSRCEAFECVKAEGDFFKVPYSTTQQETCTSPGCCGCPGQCSKCPPILPDCSTWQLDGTWKVAFADGSEAKYSFDAHGHCEMELPPSALPTTLKVYKQTYIPEGNDVEGYPQWLSMQDAERLCTQAPDCRSITYDKVSRTSSADSRDIYFIYLKTTAAFAQGPGSGWVTHIVDQTPELHGEAALAGPVTGYQFTTNGTDTGTARFDLHRAAPQLFPEDSMEIFTVVDGELKVQRRVRGQVAQSGVGIWVK